MREKSHHPVPHFAETVVIYITVCASASSRRASLVDDAASKRRNSLWFGRDRRSLVTAGRLDRAPTFNFRFLPSTKCHMAPPSSSHLSCHTRSGDRRGLEQFDTLPNLPSTASHARWGATSIGHCASLCGPGFKTTDALGFVSPQTVTALAASRGPEIRTIW